MDSSQLYVEVRRRFLREHPGHAVVEVATHVMRTCEPGAVERITELVATSADPLLTQEINGLVVRAYLDADDVTSALRTWRTILDDDRLAALPDLVGTLNRGCRAIAAIDRGHTLIALYRVLVDARGWWESASFGPDRTS